MTAHELSIPFIVSLRNLTGDEFEDWLEVFLTPLVTELGGRIVRTEKFSRRDCAGVDYDIIFPAGTVWEEEVVFSVDATMSMQRKMDNYQGRRSTTAMITPSLLMAWIKSDPKRDVLNLLEKSEQAFDALVRGKHSGEF